MVAVHWPSQDNEGSLWTLPWGGWCGNDIGCDTLDSTWIALSRPIGAVHPEHSGVPEDKMCCAETAAPLFRGVPQKQSDRHIYEPESDWLVRATSSKPSRRGGIICYIYFPEVVNEAHSLIHSSPHLLSARPGPGMRGALEIPARSSFMQRACWSSGQSANTGEIEAREHLGLGHCSRWGARQGLSGGIRLPRWKEKRCWGNGGSSRVLFC